MYFTIILAVLALLGLLVIFGVTYQMKGLKIALIAAVATLIVFAVLYIAAIYVITRTM